MKEFAFDITLRATVRLSAHTEKAARDELAECLDCTDANLGAWSSGDPITAEASIDGRPTLFEIDGEPTCFDTERCRPTLAEMSPFHTDWPCFEAILAHESYNEEYKCRLVVRMLANAYSRDINRNPFSSSGHTESALNEFEHFMRQARKLCGLPETELTAEEEAQQ